MIPEVRGWNPDLEEIGGGTDFFSDGETYSRIFSQIQWFIYSIFGHKLFIMDGMILDVDERVCLYVAIRQSYRR